MKNKAELLKQEILNKTKEYYELVHKPVQKSPFHPGQSRVAYAGRVFDEHEMVNLVASSLDFWLTYGDYSRQFETQLAGYLGVQWAFLVNSGSSANLLAFSHSLLHCSASGRFIVATKLLLWLLGSRPQWLRWFSTGLYLYLSMSNRKPVISMLVSLRPH